jgi:hypothetical protein
MSVSASAGEAIPTNDGGRVDVRLTRLAVGLAILAIVEVGGIFLLAARGDPRFRMSSDLVVIGFMGSVILFPTVGALIVQRRPRTRVAWVMILMGLGLGLGLLSFGYGAIGMPPSGSLPLAMPILIFSQLFFIPTVAGGAALILLLFPTDTFLTPRWRIVAVIALIGCLFYEVGELLRPRYLDSDLFPGVVNPLGVAGVGGTLFGAVSLLGNVGASLAIVSGAVSLVVRYRRSGPVEQAQIRWIALVGALAATAFVVSALQIEPISGITFGLGMVVLASLPIAIGVAITRYHLYDIDRLINRTLVYGSLTAILAGVFTAAIGLAQRLFVATTGEKSDAAIVLTTLVVATLYAPLRRRLEAIVDRRFKYDERRFGAYRDELEQLLGVLDPDRAAARLATEAARELAAIGAAVVDDEGQPIATAGRWPSPVVVRLAIQGGTPRIQAVLVGPRSDGRLHDPLDVDRLQDVAALVGTAIRLGRSGQGTRGEEDAE